MHKFVFGLLLMGAMQLQAVYDTRSSLVNLEDHQSSPSSMNHSSAILMQYGSRHDSSNLSHSEALQNSPNLTACRIDSKNSAQELVGSTSNHCPPSQGPHCEIIKARHVEPGGIGYKQGYTSLDLFLTVPNLEGNFLPFLDLRGHIFNDAKYAANAGMALRWSSPVKWVFGLNAYYDYRQSPHKHYNQVSGGLEALGKYVDFRINGYFPVGWRRSLPYDFFFQMNPNSTFVLNAKREFAMSGADAEVGYHIPPLKWLESYIAAGPYYLHTSKVGDCSWGGKVQFTASIYSYLTLEGNLSYDRVFHWIGQGAVALNFPFGPKRTGQSKNKEDALWIENRLFQPIRMNEIIVVDTKRSTL